VKKSSIEIISIGTELLKGRIVNTNGAEISRTLMMNGFPTSRHTVVSDEPAQLKAAFIESMKRSQVVITTGGLGPTCDDLTRPIAAALFDSDFYLDETILKDLQKRYGPNVISLEDQATQPKNAIILKNDLGTAPGLIFHNEKNTLILMPGVSKEMRAILQSQVIPYLLKNFTQEHYDRRHLHFFNLSETLIDPSMRELQRQFPGIEFGIYPSHGIVSVEAMVRGKNKDLSEQLSEACQSLKTRFIDHYFESENGKIEEEIHRIFIENHLTLSLAESCTGGSIASRLTQKAGASAFFLGSLVCYSNEMKHEILRVPKDILSQYGAVSEQTVLSMVTGLLKVTQSDFGLAVSGVAGPTGGTERTPVGTVWVGVGKKGAKPFAKCLHATGNREMVIEYTVNCALGILRNAVLG